MEDNNKTIVIRLAGVIIFLIVVIISMVIAVVFYKMNTENKKKIDELSNYSNSLEYEKQSLQSEVEKLKEKNKELEDEVNDWKDRIKEDMGKEYVKEVEFGFKNQADTNEHYDYDISSIPEEDIKVVVSDFIKKYMYMENSDIKLFTDSGLTDENKIENYELVIDSYYKTDIKFDDYKNLMLKYMTKECFNNSFCMDIKEKDGELYYSDAYSYPSDLEFKILNIKKGEEENEYIVTVNKKYDVEEEESEYSIEIVKKAGKPLVNSVY